MKTMNSNNCRWRKTLQVQLIAIYLFEFKIGHSSTPCCGYHNTHAHTHNTLSDVSQPRTVVVSTFLSAQRYYFSFIYEEDILKKLLPRVPLPFYYLIILSYIVYLKSKRQTSQMKLPHYFFWLLWRQRPCFIVSSDTKIEERIFPA